VLHGLPAAKDSVGLLREARHGPRFMVQLSAALPNLATCEAAKPSSSIPDIQACPEHQDSDVKDVP
jgi:hypothetical protein